jgi:hypothetical protein
MKNITITLPEEAARWARVRAAELDTSVSRLVGDLLIDLMRQEEGYRAAMRLVLTRKPVKLSARGTRYPTRDELHGRDSLR